MKNKYYQLPIFSVLILSSLVFAIIVMNSCKKNQNDDHEIAQIQQEYNQARTADNALAFFTDSLIMCRNYQSLPNDSTYYITNMYRCDSLYHVYDSNMMYRFYGMQHGATGMMGNNMGINFMINGMQCQTAFELLHNTHTIHHPL